MDTKIGYSHGRHGSGGHTKGKVYSNVVCQFWLAGKCNRNPCRFLHRELPTNSQRQLPTSKFNVYKRTPKQPNTSNYASNGSEPSLDPPKKRSKGNNMPASTSECSEYTSMEGITSCTEVVNMDCSKNSGAVSPVVEPCTKDFFSMLAELKGHSKAICGIALPSGSDKLYSASNDGIVNVWDCNSGHSTRTINLGGTVGCLIGEGSWIFIGMYNSIKAWNIKTEMEYILLGEGNESFGLVYAMDTIDDTGDDMLFSGGQDGSIFAWKGSDDNLKPFKLAACLKGHTACVTCLIVGGSKRLYSGSTDGTIRVWNRDTLKCLLLLRKEHTGAVMSLICWDVCLLSCSLDKKIKVWAATEEDTIDVIYTHDVKQGAIAMCGMYDAEKKPLLLCSCIDGCTTLFDLPSFKERGRICSKVEVRRIAIGPGGLFFTGEALGTLKAWQLAGSSGRIVPQTT